MGLGTQRVLAEQDFRDISSTKEMAVGTRAETPDGRVYRYTLAGGTTLDPGKLTVAATVNSDVQNVQAGEDAAVGATSVTVEAAGAITASVYADGYLTVNDATGEGITYLVKDNKATTGAADMVVTLRDPIKVALVDNTSEVSLSRNPWSGTVISVTDQSDMPVGVPNVSITNAYYGWTQTGGVCSVLADEAITAGEAVASGSSTAGAVETADADDSFKEIGVALEAGVDTEYHAVYLTIDN